MHSLEVFRGHVRVPLRCFKVRVPHDLLQQKNISTPPQIACCESVTSCVECAPWCGESPLPVDCGSGVRQAWRPSGAGESLIDVPPAPGNAAGSEARPSCPQRRIHLYSHGIRR